MSACRAARDTKTSHHVSRGGVADGGLGAALTLRHRRHATLQRKKQRWGALRMEINGPGSVRAHQDLLAHGEQREVNQPGSRSAMIYGKGCSRPRPT